MAATENGAEFECKKKTPRKWTESETASLIEMLEVRSCLWNIFEKSYHSREARENAFREMESELKIGVADIKAKMTSLRAQLGREHARTRTTKSGQAVSDLYKSSWIFWDSLQFLTPVLNAGKSKDNLGLANNEVENESESEPETKNTAQAAASASACDQGTPGNRKSKRRRVEERKEELLSTCIKVLQEPPAASDGQVRKVSAFAKYVDEKLGILDRRARTLAEKRISDILFDLEMASGDTSSHSDSQFQQFGTSGTDNNVYMQRPVQSSGQFLSLLKGDGHYY